jgi:cardiolipin synthase (CMP-forming)
MMRTMGAPRGEDRIATVPNLLSSIRIAATPVFVVLILHHGTEMAGLLLMGGILATDWVDGQIARRMGQVSNLGKLLDPLADRLAIAAGLIAIMARHAFPLWAGLLILVRDGAVLLAVAALAMGPKIRIDVRWIGKAATFGLMCGVPLVAWANFDLTMAGAARMVGWTAFWVGIVLYYAAAAMYVVDVRGALADRSADPRPA